MIGIYAAGCSACHGNQHLKWDGEELLLSCLTCRLASSQHNINPSVFIAFSKDQLQDRSSCSLLFALETIFWENTYVCILHIYRRYYKYSHFSELLPQFLQIGIQDDRSLSCYESALKVVEECVVLSFKLSFL